MRPLPSGITEQQWVDLIRGTPEMRVKADVLLNGQVVAEDIPILDGQILQDATAARFARLNCTIATPDRLPATAGDVLVPTGYELRVAIGLVVRAASGAWAYWFGEQALWLGGPATWGGNPEDEIAWVPQGVFPISQSDIATPGKVTTISAWDRSWRVQRAKFEAPYRIEPDTNYADAIADLLADRMPGIETNFPSIDFDTPLLVFDEWSDPWAAAQRMARSCGYALRFDADGIAEMVPDAAFDGEPEETISTSANAVRLRHSLDAEGTYNAQTVVSSNPSNDDVYSATVTDDDPDSITYWDGPFGHVPADPVQSEFARSDAHCEAEARSRLNKTRGIAASVDATAAPNPRRTAGSLVLIEAEEFGMSQPHIIDRLTIGLTPSMPSTLTTRTRQVVTLG